MDAYAYNYSSIHLDHFCGFINLEYVWQREIIWNIRVQPNIHINFLIFSLFEFNIYWWCDFEYLRAVATNKNSTFCGKRLPWVYDASDSSVKMVFFTERFGSLHYQLQFQYYGAYVPNTQHFTLFMKPYLMSDMHVPNIKQNAFETFHFVAAHRLDIVYLEAVNVCTTEQVVCYDGPGINSPTLHCNQSICQSFTFQMVCRFSRTNPDCSKAPTLYYHGIQPNIEHFDKMNLRNRQHVKVYKTAVYGLNSKYIYINSLSFGNSISKRNVSLHIDEIDISFPYMLYEN